MRGLAILLSVLFGLVAPGAQAPPDASFHPVSYVEVLPASRAAATAAFRQYRQAAAKQDGYVRADVFEQIGRPGHFAIVETWRDQKAFDAAASGPLKVLLDALQPIRSSGYDQRPYKTLTVDSRGSTAGGAISVVTHVDTSQSPLVPELLRRLAEASRREQGNVRFDVVQHMMRANHFTVIESWQSEKSLEAHAAAAHTRQYRDELQPMTGSPLDERIYRSVE
jgi:quinol monooxygenase YgiN